MPADWLRRQAQVSASSTSGETQAYANTYTYVMEIGVKDVAERLGVTERRALQLINAGTLRGRQVSGRWLVAEEAIPRSRLVSRPMSFRMAWAFINLISGNPIGVAPRESYRLLAKQRELMVSPHPDQLLRSWLRLRADVVRLAMSPSDIKEFLADHRVVPSGISDSRSGISAGREAECYVSPHDVDALVLDYLMAPSDETNVWLHVSDQRLCSPAPIGLVMADLADHDGAREDGQLSVLLGGNRP